MSAELDSTSQGTVTEQSLGNSEGRSRIRLRWLVPALLLSMVGLIVVLVPMWASDRAALNEDLIIEARSGRVDGVHELLERGADPNARDLPVEGRSFWQRLLDRLSGVKLSEADARTVLSYATDSRKPEAVVKLLLERGADVKADNACKFPAIIWASRGGHLNTVRLLLDAGADPNARDGVGFTPFEGAVLSDNVALVQLLLERGAKPVTMSVVGGHLSGLVRSQAMRDLLTKAGQANGVKRQP